MPMLFDTLIHFRAHPMVLTADIEQAFLQVGIHQSHRDNFRFYGLMTHVMTIPTSFNIVTNVCSQG